MPLSLLLRPVMMVATMTTSTITVAVKSQLSGSGCKMFINNQQHPTKLRQLTKTCSVHPGSSLNFSSCLEYEHMQVRRTLSMKIAISLLETLLHIGGIFFSRLWTRQNAHRVGNPLAIPFPVNDGAGLHSPLVTLSRGTSNIPRASTLTCDFIQPENPANSADFLSVFVCLRICPPVSRRDAWR